MFVRVCVVCVCVPSYLFTFLVYVMLHKLDGCQLPLSRSTSLAGLDFISSCLLVACLTVSSSFFAVFGLALSPTCNLSLVFLLVFLVVFLLSTFLLPPRLLLLSFFPAAPYIPLILR